MTKKTHLDQLNAEVTEAIFVAERLDNPVYLKSLGPLYPAHLQLRIKAWERVKQAEDALHRTCLAKNLETEYEVANRGAEQATETIKALRREAAYRGADYYACNDPEELQHESAEEAIRDYLDNLTGSGDTWRETIAEAAPVEVTAYTRKEVPEAQIRVWAERMVEDLEETVAEDYGGPDGLRLEGKEALTVEIMAAARKSINATHIWQCDQVGTREYSEEELLEMFKEDIEEEEAEEKV